MRWVEQTLTNFPPTNYVRRICSCNDYARYTLSIKVITVTVPGRTQGVPTDITTEQIFGDDQLTPTDPSNIPLVSRYFILDRPETVLCVCVCVYTCVRVYQPKKKITSRHTLFIRGKEWNFPSLPIRARHFWDGREILFCGHNSFEKRSW